MQRPLVDAMAGYMTSSECGGSRGHSGNTLTGLVLETIPCTQAHILLDLKSLKGKKRGRTCLSLLPLYCRFVAKGYCTADLWQKGGPEGAAALGWGRLHRISTAVHIVSLVIGIGSKSGMSTRPPTSTMQSCSPKARCHSLATGSGPSAINRLHLHTKLPFSAVQLAQTWAGKFVSLSLTETPVAADLTSLHDRMFFTYWASIDQPRALMKPSPLHSLPMLVY